MKRFVAIALVLAGCTNPDDILAVRGTVSSVDPVEGQVVRLTRQRVSGLNLGQPCVPTEPFKEMNTGADGAFEFEVFRLETRDTCFRAEATFPSESVSWSSVLFYGATTELAPLLDWRANPSIDGGVLHFDPPVAWPDDLPPMRMGNTYRTGIQLTHREQLVTSDGELAWQADDRSLSADAGFDFPPTYRRELLLLDDLRLEDFEGTVILSASLSDPDQQSSSIVSPGPTATLMRAGQKLAVRGNRVPLSRGLECPEVGFPCPLTDGLLTEVDAGLVEAVTLSLPAPATISSVVLRGAWVGNGVIRVALTPEDGGVETEAELTLPRPNIYAGVPLEQQLNVLTPEGSYINFREAFVVIPLDAGVPSSRVSVKFPSRLARIRELSVFE